MYRSSRGSTEIVVAVGVVTALLVGGILATSIDNAGTNHSRQSFLDSFNRSNVERAAHDFPQLDWCSECYRYDRSWALEYEKCLPKIRAYEHGDTTALSWPALDPSLRPPAKPPRTW